MEATKRVVQKLDEERGYQFKNGVPVQEEGEFSRATVEAYESDDQANNLANEKRMEKASQDSYGTEAKRRGPMDIPSNHGPGIGIPAGPPRQRALG